MSLDYQEKFLLFSPRKLAFGSEEAKHRIIYCWEIKSLHDG